MNSNRKTSLETETDKMEINHLNHEVHVNSILKLSSFFSKKYIEPALQNQRIFDIKFANAICGQTVLNSKTGVAYSYSCQLSLND
jgi:hypothetical protein